MSPAPRFPHQALAGHTTNFGQKIWGEENRRQSSRSKDPWATAEEFPNTDPVDSTHRTSDQRPEKGRAGGETPTRGTGGLTGLGTGAKGGGVKMADAPV